MNYTTQTAMSSTQRYWTQIPPQTNRSSK